MGRVTLPVLGVGIGFREQFAGELFLNQDKVGFLEIIADHYIDPHPNKEKELAILKEHFTLVPHAINLSLGSAEGLNQPYLKKLANLVNKLNPPWWSEHICFTQAGGIDIGHLSPLPFTWEAIDVIVKNIKQVKEYINAPLILENITYMLEIPGAEMSEAEFISEILMQTDCGLLLDITNLHINSVNHKFDIESFLNSIPLERVVQLHFVGGHYHHNLLIDSHSHPTPREVWQLMETVAKRTCLKGVILERDENFPPFNELLTELEQARQAIKVNKPSLVVSEDFLWV
ncbi:MAG: DUF692 domain-containing protein [Acidobacteria bacterium]|nr:DUF692 domain-containing protein [Acidobacteriota bacterium]